MFEMPGTVRTAHISVVGGLNIHDAVSSHLNEIHQQLGPYDPSDLTKLRKLQIVYGYPELDAMHGALFEEGAKERPDYDDLFDNYYFRAFLTAEKEGRKLLGKEFSEAAFEGAPEFMSLHVTVSLS